jgi:hypothetical protein
MHVGWNLSSTFHDDDKSRHARRKRQEVNSVRRD